MVETRPIVRILAALVLVVHAAWPAVAAAAEAPLVPVTHETHVSAQGDGGCDPLHDELECLLCRVLAGPSAVTPAVLAPRLSGAEGLLSIAAAACAPQANHHPSSNPARAPPVL